MLQFRSYTTSELDRLNPQFFASTLTDEYRETPRYVFVRPVSNDEDVTDFVPGVAQFNWCLFARVTAEAGNYSN